LRGAGDTRSVTVVDWAWVFASAYIIGRGLTFLLGLSVSQRKSMRVIERTPPPEEIAA
jgi:hypothetical protein